MLVPTLLVSLTAGALGSQGTPGAQPAPPVDEATAERRLNPAQPDFTLVGLTNDDWYIGFNITRKFYRGR